MVTNLTNSDGWKLTIIKEIHLRLPLTSLPIPGINTSINIIKPIIKNNKSLLIHFTSLEEVSLSKKS